MLAIVDPPAEALAWNEKAMALAESSSDPKAQKWLGSLYNNIGWTWHDQGQYEKALATFQKGLAWRVARQQPKEARIAMWTVARALRSLKKYDEALAMQKELEAEIAKIAEPDGFVFEEIAEILLAQNKPAAAYFARAHELLSKDPWLARDEPERLARLQKLGAR